MAWVPTDRWPSAISGAGIVLVASLVVESIAFLTTPIVGYSAFGIGVVTSLPFAAGVAYGGYWLARSELPPARYGQVGRWWVAVTLGTVLLISAINLRIQPLSALVLVGTVRWSAAVGGGAGLLIGILQARAVLRGMEAERARRRRRETERDREYLESFAEVVSHELQNPLHVAQGHLELLREERDSPHLDTVAEAHRRMSEVVEDTLKLARMNGAIGDAEPVDLAAVAGVAWDAAVDAADPADAAGATLEIADTRTVDADREHLRDLLCELFRNAVEHGTASGEAASGDATGGADAGVTVRVGLLADANGFYVEDDGPGIPEPDRDAVFTPGYAGPSGNTGLGLAFVKRIAEGHGWEVAATGSRDGGARVEVSGVEPGR